ncbi:carboxymuconolactone decarboxylase family protein [Rhodovarius crocodyli]|uniref:Carboxymuconolactone decarboxylase family protein n=1 Tax=Rhodovarius crocodyli TaxID=1979269 RepID=A0A437M3F4_9PROT|nr:carboxymuconolactone decarboxylase family protein [Rhodovarius crocodyli]RVT92126.1 carboxymuconolactone decarboxylase family protein [Rhodovarius crocodyli]
MSRIPLPGPEDTPAASRPLLDGLARKLGSVPNLYRLLALSPAGLEAALGLSGALSRTLDAPLRERIAIAVAQVNGCEYCLSAHAYLGARLAGLPPEEIAANRLGHSLEARADAAVTFAARVAQHRGQITNEELAQVKAAGFTDAEVLEIVLTVALNGLTNLVNNVARTPVDFPPAPAQA